MASVLAFRICLRRLKDIAGQVAAIQQATKSAVDAIKDVGRV
jgi:hypothetical protein